MSLNTAITLNGNASAIAATTSSADTQLVIGTSGGSLPGAFYIVNDSANVAFVNVTTDATANVVVPAGDQNGRGILLTQNTPVIISTGQTYNQAPGNIYITAVTGSGTAFVYITPVA